MIKLSKIFEPIYGVNLDYKDMIPSEKGIPYVSRSSNNNGVSGLVKKIDGLNPNPGHTISVACGGSVLECFYQESEYYSGRDVYFLKPKKKLTSKEMVFYCHLINFQKFRYNYGRQANKTLNNLLLLDKKFFPKWLKKYDLKYLLPSPPVNKKQIKLSNTNWIDFKLDDIFEIKGTKTTPKKKLKEYGLGTHPYVTTQTQFNGIDGYYNYYTEKGNVLCVDSAVSGFVSYQKKDFSASDHVEVLKPKNFILNEFTGLFISEILNLENYRFNYGRKCSQTRMKDMTIKLPAIKKEKNYNVDTNFIENYMKSIKFSKLLKI